MEFHDRLKNYREDLGVHKKRDMAAKLEIGESFYNLLESGSRKPSENILRKLFLLSNRPEEYWLYGIDEGKEYIEARKEFKCLRDAIDQLQNIGLLKLGQGFSKGVEEVLWAATVADVTHILEKKQLKGNGKEGK